VDDKQSVVVGGKKQKEYSAIGANTLIFSPDSQRVAYAARVGSGRYRKFVVVDGKEGKKYDNISEGSLSFTPDSKKAAYAARKGSNGFVVVDAEEGSQYDDIVTRAGGRIVFDSPDRLQYLARKGSRIYLVEERIK